METVPSALIILDLRLTITSANRAFYRTFLTSPDETVGCNIYALGNGQWDIPALHTLLDSVLPARDSVERFEVEHNFPTIGRRTMLVNARRIMRPGGQDDAILLAIEDVSAARKAQADGDRAWRLTQSIVDTIQDPLVVLEDDMTIVTASRAFLTLFGITEAEIQGRLLAEVGQHQMDTPALRHLMEKVLPENRPIDSFEIEDDFPGLGRRVYTLAVRKVLQPGNHSHRLLLVFTDITDRKQRERDTEVLTNEISHRIKNNLQLVVGLIGFEARRAAAPCVSGYLAMQSRIGAIAQLYDLISQSAAGDAVAIDGYLMEIARTVTESLLGVGSNITIVVDVAHEQSGRAALRIDADRAVPLGLLINELATNAIKHAFPDGVGCVTLSAVLDGVEMVLTVADDGAGLRSPSNPAQPQARGYDYVGIFVRQLSGELATNSVDGGGVTVQIRIPLEAD